MSDRITSPRLATSSRLAGNTGAPGRQRAVGVQYKVVELGSARQSGQVVVRQTDLHADGRIPQRVGKREKCRPDAALELKCCAAVG